MKKYRLFYFILIPALIMSCGKAGDAGNDSSMKNEASGSMALSSEEEEAIVALPSAGSGAAADAGELGQSGEEAGSGGEAAGGEADSEESGPDGEETSGKAGEKPEGSSGEAGDGAEGNSGEGAGNKTEESQGGDESGKTERNTGEDAGDKADLTSEKSGEDKTDATSGEASGNTGEAVPEEAEPEKEEGDGMSDMQGFSKAELTDDIKQRINGLSYKSNCTVPYEDLRYLRVLYVDFSGQTRSGEIICNKKIADDLLEIFEHLYNAGYQIDKIRLVDEYGADDDLSCADDNTSCFNFRVVEGTTKLSKHAMGMAIDINPFYNPYITYPNGNIRISPPGSEGYADRNADFPHKIDKNDLAYKEFMSHGFTWGGDWKSTKDYQHFQKG